MWLSIEETKNIEGGCIANVIIETLEAHGSGTMMLLNSEVLNKANYSTVSKLFEKFLNLICTLLFLSDTALYMVKATGAIQAFTL